MVNIMSNFYTAVTAAAICIPLAISAPVVSRSFIPVEEIVINVDLTNLSESEREDYFYNLSYQTCLKESVKVTLSSSTAGAQIANSCANSISELKENSN